MRIHVLLAVALLGASAFGAEKELQLADGRILRGELMGEQDGQVVLALKVDEITANVRIDKKDILSVKDATAVQAPVAVVAQVVQAAPAAKSDEGDFARVRQLLAAASKESAAEDAQPSGSFYDGYPYPMWQNWPWLFTLGGDSWYVGSHGHWGGHDGGHEGGHGGHGGKK